MSAPYNQFAGQNLERLTALSDGVFAIAMTLLALDLHIPPTTGIHTDPQFWPKLVPLARNFLPYVMSFLTLGIFWVGQQTQLQQFKRSNRNLAWIHLGFLFAVTLMPFSTSLLAAFIAIRSALIIYWLNILLLGLMLYIGHRYAARANLLKDDVTPEMRATIERRILIAQALYAVGAALCLINTYVSIVAIVLVQLNYVIAPRIRLLYRL